jgi:hypothetical protein
MTLAPITRLRLTPLAGAPRNRIMWEREESASQFSRAFIHSRCTTDNTNNDNTRRHVSLNRLATRYLLDDNRSPVKATMAMSPSPQLSPVLGPSFKMERHHTNSPPQQLSKRDKRRTLLADRLEEITRHFSQNRDIHYREQLQALQIDMNLIMEADAHGKEPLPSSPGSIEALVEENIKALRKAVAANPPSRAGKLYAAFAKEINDAIEERDAALTMHMVGGNPIPWRHISNCFAEGAPSEDERAQCRSCVPDEAGCGRASCPGKHAERPIGQQHYEQEEPTFQRQGFSRNL